MEFKIFLDEELSQNVEPKRINDLMNQVEEILPEIITNSTLLKSLKIDIANVR